MNDVIQSYPTTFYDFNKAIRQITSQKHNLALQSLEYADMDPQWPTYIVDYHSKHPCGYGLISTGIHGDEPAGPWAVLKFLNLLNEQPEVAHNWDLTLLPLLNPSGFERCQRTDAQGVDLNRGHVHIEPEDRVSSWINALHTMLNARKFDFVLSLHEDVEQTAFYLYSYELNPPFLGQELISFMRRYFQIVEADIVENTAADQGLLVGDHDGSLEDWLHHIGVPRILVLEIPGRCSRDVRVEASLQSILYLLPRFCGVCAAVHY